MLSRDLRLSGRLALYISVGSEGLSWGIRDSVSAAEFCLQGGTQCPGRVPVELVPNGLVPRKDEVC